MVTGFAAYSARRAELIRLREIARGHGVAPIGDFARRANPELGRRLADLASAGYVGAAANAALVGDIDQDLGRLEMDALAR